MLTFECYIQHSNVATFEGSFECRTFVYALNIIIILRSVSYYTIKKAMRNQQLLPDQPYSLPQIFVLLTCCFHRTVGRVKVVNKRKNMGGNTLFLVSSASSYNPSSPCGPCPRGICELYSGGSGYKEQC